MGLEGSEFEGVVCSQKQDGMWMFQCRSKEIDSKTSCPEIPLRLVGIKHHIGGQSISEAEDDWIRTGGRVSQSLMIENSTTHWKGRI